MAKSKIWSWIVEKAQYLVGNRSVSQTTVHNIVVKKFSVGQTQINVEALTERLINGSMDLPAWQAAMRKEIKMSSVSAAMAGKGGRASMTQSDWGRVGGRIGFQNIKLDSFARDIYAGTLTEGEIRMRAVMYAKSSRTHYYDTHTRVMIETGLTEERRVLGGDNHCIDCVAFADMGWQPIGSLPEPGTDSVCYTNCNCDKDYRK